MSPIREIELAVTQLSAQDLARFRQWFDEYDAQEWDEQFERDAESGKLDDMAEKAIADFRAGKFKEI